MTSNIIVESLKKYVSRSHRFITVGSGSTSIPPDTLVTLTKRNVMTIEDGNVGIGTTVPLYSLDTRGDINFTGILRQNGAPYVSSQWTSNNATNSVYYNGNVGIGTATPLYKLHVEGTSYFNGTVTTNNNNIDAGTGTITASALAGGVITNSTSITNSSVAASATAVKSAYDLASAALPKTGGTVTGNVVILANLTASNLTVIGDTTVLNTVSSNTEQMVITNAGTGPALKVTQSGNNSVAEFYDNESGIALFVGNNGNVGIGTTNPQYAVDVIGDVNFTGILRQGGAAYVSSQWTSNNATDSLYYNGNVGIGTATPLYKLHVEGTSYLNGIVTTNNNNINAGTGIITAGSLAGGVITNSTSTTSSTVAASATAVKSAYDLASAALPKTGGGTVTGNVFISGNLTASNLTVIGDTTVLNTVSSNTEQMVITNAGTGPALKVTQSGNNSVAEFYDNESGIAMTIGNNGYIGIGKTDPQSKLDIVGNMNITGDINANNVLYINSGANNTYAALSSLNGAFLSIEAYNSGNTVKRNIVLAGYGGSVGIGTTNPLEKFHIRGKAYIDNTLTAAPTNGVLGSTGTRLILWPGGTSSVPYSIGIANATLWYAVPSGSVHTWYTGTTERMRLDANGNVGVGSTQPISAIDTNRVRIYNNNTYGQITLARAADSSHFLSIEGTGQTGTSSLNLRNTSGPSGGGSYEINSGHFWYVNTSERMRLDGNGNLGIGTATPLYKLHVEGTSYLNGTVTTNNNNIDAGSGTITASALAGGVITNSTSITNSSVAASATAVKSAYDLASAALPKTGGGTVTGNVFISGNLTASNLTVIGDTTVLNTVSSNTEQMVITNAGTGPALKVTQSGNNSVAEFYDNESGIALFVGNNGNVGIGTTNPLYKLQVEGTSYLNGNITTNNNNINVGTGIVTAATFSGTATRVQNEHVPGTYLTGANYNGSVATTWAVDADSVASANKVVARDASAYMYASGVGIGTATARQLLDVQGGNAIISGNVGIGTTNPLKKLDVSGDINFTGSLYQNGTLFSDGGVTSFNTRTADVTLTSSDINSALTQSVTLGITKTLASASLTIPAGTPPSNYVATGFDISVNSDASGNALASTYSRGLTVSITCQSGALQEAFVQDITANANNASIIDLAIGNRTVFNVSGTAKMKTAIGSLNVIAPYSSTQQPLMIGLETVMNAGGSGGIATAKGIFNDIFVDEGSYGTLYSIHNVTNMTGDRVTTAYGIYNDFNSLSTNNSTWGLYLTGEKKNYMAGNVGIGTTDPSKKLDVNGDINFNGSLYQNNSLYISSQWTSNNATNSLYYNGNVGIGTTNPLQKLHVEGTEYVSGSIGIGLTQPAYALDVAGYIRSSLGFRVGANEVIDSDGNFILRSIQVLSGTGDTSFFVSETGYIGIGTDNPVVPLDIRSTNVNISGDVGIGTTSPLQKLDVYGNATIGNGQNGSASTIAGGPFIKQNSWDAAAITHTLVYPVFCVGDNSAGTLFIQVSNKLTSGTRRIGTAQYSFIKCHGANIDLFESSYHRNVNLTNFTVTTNGDNIVVTTDSDCSISWTSIGSY